MTWYTQLSLVDLAAVNYSAGMESCCEIFLVCVLIARAGVWLSSVIRIVLESWSVFSRRDVVLGVICADICAICIFPQHPAGCGSCLCPCDLA